MNDSGPVSGKNRARLYLAQSVPEERRDLLQRFLLAATGAGLELTEGTRPWQPQNVLPPSAGGAIEAADCYLAFLMKGGPYLYYVNMEAGYIRNRCQQKPVILLVEDGVVPPGTLLNLHHRKIYTLDWQNPETVRDRIIFELGGIPALSGNRIFQEFFRLLLSPQESLSGRGGPL